MKGVFLPPQFCFAKLIAGVFAVLRAVPGFVKKLRRGLRCATRGEHNGPYSERRLSGGDGLIIPAHVDVPQDRIPIVNWLIIAGAIAVFVWQTLSIHERKQHLSEMTAKYE